MSKKYLSYDDALARMQKYCAYQERCHQEVRRKLIGLGIYGLELENILIQLIEDDFLNEERFARSYARGKFEMNGWGRIRIRQELYRRDISEFCIGKAMEEIDPSDYRATLEKTVRKKSARTREADPFVKRNKVAAYCIRRGFEPPLVWEKVKELVKDDA